MENLDGELLERVFFFFPKNKNGKERLETLLDTLKKLLHIPHDGSVLDWLVSTPFFYRIFFPSLACEREAFEVQRSLPIVEDQEPLEKGPEVTSPILGCYVDIYLTIVIFSFNFYMLDLPLIH